MSKELDEAWTTICHYNEEIIHDIGSEYVENPLKEEIDIINNALLELKAIKEAKPSEALIDLEKIKIGFGCDMAYYGLNVEYETVKQALIKAQEMEQENVYCAGGRSFGKDFLYLRQSFEQCKDTPIFYVSRTCGNKYIVPQKQFDDLTNENIKLKRVLEIIKGKGIDIGWLEQCETVEKYNYHCEANQLTEEEFELLKEA